MPPEELVTVREAARRTRLSEEYLRRRLEAEEVVRAGPLELSLRMSTLVALRVVGVA